MPSHKSSYPNLSYDKHARTCDPDDFLGQSKRTVNGEPVSENQILMIISKIKSTLELNTDDILLDLACGNGSLSHYFFDSCKGYSGVDISEHLISVAKKNFEKLPFFKFSNLEALEYLKNEEDPGKFTKMLIYASSQYFLEDDLVKILLTTIKEFKNVESIFIGNIPNKDCSEMFYKTRTPSKKELNDPTTALGIWRTKEEFSKIAKKTGWDAVFSTMPQEFYASYYRYDALLKRPHK